MKGNEKVTKTVKYVLHVCIFAMMYIFAMFLLPSLTDSRLRVCVSLYFVAAAAYVYLWFVRKGDFFTVPLAFAVIMAAGAFYFNAPSSPDMKLGMWVLAKYLVLPQGVTACVVSAVLHFIMKQRVE